MPIDAGRAHGRLSTCSTPMHCACPQASAYKSGDVVQTLKKAFMPDDGATTMTFKNEDEVLNYLGTKVIHSTHTACNQRWPLRDAVSPSDPSLTRTSSSVTPQVLLPIWKDPVCGDGTCEWPWEFPAWGRFGCRADCGTNPNTTSIAVNVRADFTGHPSISPRVLMNNAKWNLCLEDDARRKRGEADLCWWVQGCGRGRGRVCVAVGGAVWGTFPC